MDCRQPRRRREHLVDWTRCLDSDEIVGGCNLNSPLCRGDSRSALQYCGVCDDIRIELTLGHRYFLMFKLHLHPEEYENTLHIWHRDDVFTLVGSTVMMTNEFFEQRMRYKIMSTATGVPSHCAIFGVYEPDMSWCEMKQIWRCLNGTFNNYLKNARNTKSAMKIYQGILQKVDYRLFSGYIPKVCSKQWELSDVLEE